MAILIEVAISTLADARVAHGAGADRLELNAALELGGLTPSIGTLALVRKMVPLPVVAMLRPRAGGFVYSDGEFLTMQRDADVLLAQGASGLAFGFLTVDRTVDADRTRALVRQLGPSRETVFHRAFDLTADPFAAMESLIDCGVRRILTSGQKATALAGADVIRRLIERSAGRIEILPGAGVTPENAAELMMRTGATQVHGTFSEMRDDPAAEPVCAGGYRVTSARVVSATRAAIG
jgi:copper homeostasis protein